MFARLVWLSLAAFAIGTETFMIGGLLPRIAGDLGVSAAICGQLVTIFSLTYAVAAPVLATAFGNAGRKPLLVSALTVFALANLLAAAAPSYTALAGARVLLALAAATFMPAAYAVSVSIVGPDKRARALAIVAGGLTVAVALGAPIGSAIATWGSWRATFVIVAAFAFLAVGGLVVGLERDLPVTRLSLGQRLSVLRRPAILATLATMTAALAAGFVMFVYMAPLFAASTHLGQGGVTAALFAGGIGGAIGNGVGGQLADRFGPARVMSVLLACLTLNFFLISLSAVKEEDLKP